MRHPFGDLLRQLRARKPGLTQERLAHLIGYDQAVLARMAQGKKDLTGPSGRDRVVSLINALRDEGALTDLEEANALLAAANLPPLYSGIPMEAALMRSLGSSGTTRQLEFAAATSQLVSPPVCFVPPVPVSSLVGRDSDIGDVAGLIQESRLVTLTGPGGSGKTRLALEVARQVAAGFTNGVCFVSLAQVQDVGDVPAAIAHALELSMPDDRTHLQTLQNYLRQKHLLLILDNFEHLLDTAPLVTAILADAPQIKVLVTSRANLHVNGEHEFQVEPLSVPLQKVLPTVMELSEIAAVKLFVQRARAVQRHFELMETNAAAVVDICRWSDGLPLAIELAAARVRQYSPEELLVRLNATASSRNFSNGRSNVLSILSAGPRDLPTRQRAIRDTINWSYQLLGKDEQRLLRWLGIFIGGATFPEIIWLDEQFTLEQVEHWLQSLVDKNLVRTVPAADGASRYMLLELIREFALEEMKAQGELRHHQYRHAQAFAALAADANRNIYGRGQAHWTARLDHDYDNIRAALNWCFSDVGDAELGCQIVGCLNYFWYVGSRSVDAQHWMDRAGTALNPDMAPIIRGDVLVCIANNDSKITRIRGVELCRDAIACYQQDNNLYGIAMAKCLIGEYVVLPHPGDAYGLQVLTESEAIAINIGDEYLINRTRILRVLQDRPLQGDAHVEPRFREAVEVLQAGGNDVHTAQMLCHYAHLLMCLLKFQEALDCAEKAVYASRKVHNPAEETWALGLAAEITHHLGDSRRAIALLEDCLALIRDQLRDHYATPVLILLAKAISAVGDYPRAYSALREALHIMRTTSSAPDQNYGSSRDHNYGSWLDALAIVYSEAGDWVQAARLFGMADSQWESGHRPRPHSSAWEQTRYRETACINLGKAAYESTYEQGRMLTRAQLFAELKERFLIN